MEPATYRGRTYEPPMSSAYDQRHGRWWWSQTRWPYHAVRGRCHGMKIRYDPETSLWCQFHEEMTMPPVRIGCPSWKQFLPAMGKARLPRSQQDVETEKRQAQADRRSACAWRFSVSRSCCDRGSRGLAIAGRICFQDGQPILTGGMVFSSWIWHQRLVSGSFLIFMPWQRPRTA